MSLDLRDYFRKNYNKRQVHLEQLRLIRRQTKLDKAGRRRLNNKIAYEQRQLAIISEIWDVN